MPGSHKRRVHGLSLLLAACACTISARAASDSPTYNRDVRPILSEHCFSCHGPDPESRKADLRLDTFEAATADRGGFAALIPGDPELSELVYRIESDDELDVMPPPESHKPLTADQKQLIRAWVADGAEYEPHWSFVPPQRADIPEIEPGQKDIHPIDAFVRRRLRQEGLDLAPAAPPHTLMRRLSFDLTGLPPAPEEVETFTADPSAETYREMVDRLLESPHHAERMAMWWLDAARYADTDGFQQDALRDNWPWRDWVVDAFRRNVPFDQFTIEQFAGDLLPDASPEQVLATAFHRNHMTNGEGGRDPEESRIDYVIDRVNTTGTVWLGMTLGCAQCHTHKFDPISHADYYELFAFFNSVDEDGRAGKAAKPYLTYESPYADRALREAEQTVDERREGEILARQDARRGFEDWLTDQIKRVDKGFFRPWHTLQPTLLESVEGTGLTQGDDGIIQAGGPNPTQDDYKVIGSPALDRITGIRLEVLPDPERDPIGLSRGQSGEFILTDVKLQVRRRGRSQIRPVSISGAVADAEREVKGRDYGRVLDTLDDDPRNGWTTGSEGLDQPHRAIFALEEPLTLEDDEELIFVMLHRSTQGDANIARFRISVTDQPGVAVQSLDPMPLERLAAAQVETIRAISPELQEALFEQYLIDHPDYQRERAKLDLAQRQLEEIRKASGPVEVMVLADRETPRTTHVLERGVWDQKGETVVPAVPEAIAPRPPDQTRSRLDLAEWLVARDNPLTARVVVNHLWQICFGEGLVRTPEDFGAQGELPTHPELLDWLAVELMDHDWDLRHLLRLIVTSDTYRQSSQFREELQERDPENRFLARAPRFRLPSWMIRDAALRSSGLLNPALGGPPVRPYQPEGVWEEMFMGRLSYEPSQGPAQYRRTLYAFWRRSAAPTFLFDSAQRRVCEVKPRRTNTPLHALTLLNDQGILEASAELARVVMTECEDVEERLDLMFTRVLSRPATPPEMTVLLREFERASRHYTQSPDDTVNLLEGLGQPGESSAGPDHERAAYTVVASMVFNLDEAISRE
ncbi:PSD1 and planctomycete cytochrome C domain-containing protein [Tautonia marina]|uniref:PSD1 and planctomycete cytochrome C domain-containing protein n=1 Tax=Tautonia marina TaxID=2653855 RepID=UPI0012608E1E|nr:PSD1 and planctomycete cytochrome C domain-containing protein [Tautonia marina]